MTINEIAAYVAPACVVYSVFAYFKVVKLRKDFNIFKGDVSKGVQDTAIDRANDRHEIVLLRQELQQMRESFIDERTCPGCGEVRQASQFEQGDYICQNCRKETYTDANGDEFPINP